jgi:arylsulfatase A-like enzyme
VHADLFACMVNHQLQPTISLTMREVFLGAFGFYLSRAAPACCGPTVAAGWLLAALFAAPPVALADAPRPNVVLIMTDDQGYGDLGAHGNRQIRTPHLDRLAAESVQLTQFYVSPVCTPTRASLMTGRYNYRTGAIDTYLGRAMMHPDEVTLAEMLAAVGYRTGIFGKWHLGDNYPLRAMDQGFQESLVHWGGGIRQPADPPQGNSYFDPWLSHNGRTVRAEGYCSDVFTTAAIDFIARDDQRPFFVYLAFNCPHTPLEVAEALSKPYLEQGLDEPTARVYGMVTNIDDNVGRLLAALDERGLANNTLVIFLTDNGPQHRRFNGGMRGIKGSVYEGGIRVPCFARWPGKVAGGDKVHRIAAHIDLAPTILEACGVAAPAAVRFDGLSLLPLLRDPKSDWPDRHLFFQWHRGDEPQRYRAFAVRNQRYKLARAEGANQPPQGPARFELFDIEADPAEAHDLASQQPELVAALRQAYDRWFDDVSATRGYEPPRIHVGAPQENPSLLTRQDWRGPQAGWSATSVGHWEIHAAAGRYDIAILVAAADTPRTVHLRIGQTQRQRPLPASSTEVVFGELTLPAGDARLEAWIEADQQTTGPRYVRLQRTDLN